MRTTRQPLCSWAVVGVGLLACASCTTTITRTPGSLMPSPERLGGASVSGGGNNAAASRLALEPICEVSYDAFTLPLVAPTGDWLAVQVGAAPTWDTILATPRATPPLASRIEVWSIGADGGRRVAESRSGLVLGRSADANGFLVEEPLADGSRRIGYCPWPKEFEAAVAERVAVAILPQLVGPVRSEADRAAMLAAPGVEPQWLVDDGRVNAFAVRGSDGALAWCTRDVDAPQPSEAVGMHGVGGFSLAIRDGVRTFEVPPPVGRSWMVPCLVSRSSPGQPLSVFAMRERDGTAELVYANASNEKAFGQSELVRPLSLRADARVIWLSLAPQSATAAVDPTGQRLVFFHPDLRRMCTWDPFEDRLLPLGADTFAAALDEDGIALVGDRDGVRRVAAPGSPADAANDSHELRIYDRPAIPRLVNSPVASLGAEGSDDGAGLGQTWILLVPERPSRSAPVVRIVRLTLLEYSDLAENRAAPTTASGTNATGARLADRPS